MAGGYGAPKSFAPLFILWFGIGIESKIALVARVVFFIVYFATLAGVRALNAKLVQMAQIVGASERQVARHIVMPGAVPAIFAGFRIAVPYAIGAAVIAELISANRGLGYLVQAGAMNFDTTSVFAAIVAATLLVLAANWLHELARSAAAQVAAADRVHAGDGDMTAPALLEVRKLGKRFAQRHGREPSPWVIQDLSFSVADGEFLTIVGPSGPASRPCSTSSPRSIRRAPARSCSAGRQ